MHITYHPRSLRVDPVTNDSSDQQHKEHHYTPEINVPLQESIENTIKDPNSRIGTIIDIYV